MLARLVVPAVVAACAAAAAAAAAADDTGPAPGRYAIAPSGQGFVRMDTETGRTSHCDKRDDAWYCEPIAEVGVPVEERVDALAAALRDLEAEVARLARALETRPDAAAPTAPATASDTGAGVAAGKNGADEGGEDGFATRVIDRFVGMVRGLKRRQNANGV